jgi:hypothetical protein
MNYFNEDETTPFQIKNKNFKIFFKKKNIKKKI